MIQQMVCVLVLAFNDFHFECDFFIFFYSVVVSTVAQMLRSSVKRVEETFLHRTRFVNDLDKCSVLSCLYNPFYYT